MKFSRVILALVPAIAGAGDLSLPRNVQSFKIGSRLLAKVSIGHDNVEDGVTADDLKAAFQIETESQGSEDLTVGFKYEHGKKKQTSVYARITQRMRRGDLETDLHLSLKDKRAVFGVVKYTSGDTETITTVNSKSSNVVEKVVFVQRQNTNGKTFLFRPTFNVKDSSMELELSAEDDDTNFLVKVKGQDNVKADAEFNRRLNRDTRVMVKVNSEHMSTPLVEVSRRLDNKNTIKPRFDAKKNKFSCAWVQRLDNGRTATVTVDPKRCVDIVFGSDDENRDENSWIAQGLKFRLHFKLKSFSFDSSSML